MSVITKLAGSLNGISIAYIMGVANAAFACLTAFGISLNPSEIASVTGLLNAVLILAVHFGHRVGEVTASGVSTHNSQAAMQAVETPSDA